MDVEKTLIKQLVAALELKYLKSFCNAVIHTIKTPLIDVWYQLFTKYSATVADKLDDVETQVKNIKFNLLDPLVTFLNKIEELNRIVTDAGNPYTETQKRQIGEFIIKNTNGFKTGLSDYLAQP